MNTPLRRISLVVMGMFVVLMLAITSIQVFQAGDLNADTRNQRATFREQGRERGPIVVAGEPIASSVAVDTPFAFLRTYANGPLYAPVTGYSSIVFGQTAVERSANTVLNGTAPSLWRQRLGDLITGRQPSGGSVELTIDPAVQQAAFDALGDREGAVVALDPSTGAILAMVSTPSYDPNLLAGHDTAAVNTAWQELLAAPGDPLVNRAIAGDTYAPGSTFKLIDLAAALSTGDYAPDTRVAAPDVLTLPGSSSTISNPAGETCDDGVTATLTLALQKSCNTPFSQLAITLGEQAIRDQAEAFGWGEELSVPMPVTPSRLGDIESEAQLGQTAIGQLDVRTTPMQIAMVAAGIANDGELMTPYLEATERAADLSIVAETEPSTLSEAVSPEVADQMTEMMVNVVENGTGWRAQIDGVRVAGKTGTSQTGINEGTSRDFPHAWFTGFAPADDPQIAVAVVLVNGADPNSEQYSGGQLAAPVAKAVLEAGLR
ncbi:peptidoglycan D,D-transpeptidase FtsI family protein [Serinibacter arcticus]|uniref:Cell division protein FtsI [Peptidoglycan synthetase] n=1 Tax=Serinibacter arcticus TaxID=1655435 RepID=A0A4Z1E608_9MICO|nr:penicillin-binding protein 2 [Serinibacter arcticus]TGO05061.1 Cell division protein FtsI [Peptidoglycan synthetase] [Serinibacter arcticus]